MSGYSNPVIFVGNVFKPMKNPSFTAVKGWGTTHLGKEIVVKPPSLNPDNVGFSLTENVNPYPEFAFDKIAVARFGESGSFSYGMGAPCNKPTPIPDYSFIALMRLVDRLVKPAYKGVIETSSPTPTPSS